MGDFHLAQFNIGRLTAPLDSTESAGFVAGLSEVNAIAESSPGFVWRHVADGTDDATATRLYSDDSILINFSVWESRESLWDFVYRSRHLEFLRRRREWFVKLAQPILVLWWVPAGTIPTVD